MARAALFPDAGTDGVNDMSHAMAPAALASTDPAMPPSDPGDGGGQAPHAIPRASQPPAPEDEPFRRVVEGAHAAVDRLADAAEPHVRTLQRELEAVGAALDTNADAWGERARQLIRDHPLGTVAAALAVGVLVERALRRRP